MNQKELRKLAIRALKKEDFTKARVLFSLAYEQKPSDEILLFIELCELARQDPLGALSLFELYSDNLNKDQSENIKTVVEIVEATNHKTEQHINSGAGISYADFIAIVAQNNDFKTTFENVIYSSKIVISSHKELAHFIEMLIKNGYNELAMHYLEDPHIALTFGQLTRNTKAKL